MMGIRISDYKNYIKYLKEEGMKQGRIEIIVTAKDLYDHVDPNSNSTMYTCCKAIKDLLLKGDKILCDPPTPSGYSSKLKVQYKLNDLSDRPSYYEVPKKGRPNESYTPEQLQEFMTNQLKNGDFCYEQRNKVFKNVEKRWNVYLIDVNTVQNFKIRIIDILLDSEKDGAVRISLLFKSFSKAKKFWNVIPNIIKQKYDMTFFHIDDGILKEFS